MPMNSVSPVSTVSQNDVQADVDALSHSLKRWARYPVAAQRALEVSAEALLLAKSGVDGVYSADPKKDPSATKYDTITYNEVLSKSLAVADAAAFALCRENKLPIVVFDLMKNGNIGRAVRGEVIGTLVA